MAAADRGALAERVDQHVEAIWGAPNPGLADALITAITPKKSPLFFL